MRSFSYVVAMTAAVSVVLSLPISRLTAQEKSKEAPISVAVSGRNQLNPDSFTNDDGTRKILVRNQIQDEAKRLKEQARYEEAVVKYREALNPSLLNHDYEGAVAHGAIRDIYIMQGKYELASDELRWFVEHNYNAKQKPWLDKELEIKVLVKARETKSSQPVYDHIQYLKEKYKGELPPKRYQSTGYSTIVTSDIIRLYDHIADYDAGIAFVDSVVNYFCSKNKSLRRVTTSQEALKKAEERGKHWREYKKIYEYLKVREAFEADKKEGRQSCVGKTGVCIGRATQALIQSDYFPW